MLGPVELNNTLHTQFARAQAFLPKQILGFLALSKFLMEEFLIWFTRPVEVFVRRKFGVRGHGTFFTIQLCVTGTIVGGLLVTRDPLVTLFCLAMAVMAVIHYFEALRWENRGSPPRYSWSSGEPVPLIWVRIARVVKLCRVNADRFLTVPLICRFYEPLLVLAVGLAVRPLTFAGYYLIGSSVALFIKGIIVHNRLLDMKRDQIDARIMSQWLAGVHQTAGGKGQEEYYVVRLAQPPVHERVDDNGGEEAAELEHQPSSATAVMATHFLSISCRKCKAQFQVHRKHQGRKGTCKKCGNVMVVAAQTN